MQVTLTKEELDQTRLALLNLFGVLTDTAHDVKDLPTIHKHWMDKRDAVQTAYDKIMAALYGVI